MQKQSAGLLMYRRREQLEVFLVHPGGPFWAARDHGAWSIPKGGYLAGEEALAAAQREFREETGFEPQAPYLELGVIRQSGGKLVTAWAFEGDCDPELLVSNSCEIEWPPSSKKYVQVPEVDRGAWFPLDKARTFLLKSQQPLLDALQTLIL